MVGYVRELWKDAERKEREAAALRKANEQRQAVTYIDDDGCEVTAMPDGKTVYYNAADWW